MEGVETAAEQLEDKPAAKGKAAAKPAAKRAATKACLAWQQLLSQGICSMLR